MNFSGWIGGMKIAEFLEGESTALGGSDGRERGEGEERGGIGRRAGKQKETRIRQVNTGQT